MAHLEQPPVLSVELDFEFDKSEELYRAGAYRSEYRPPSRMGTGSRVVFYSVMECPARAMFCAACVILRQTRFLYVVQQVLCVN